MKVLAINGSPRKGWNTDLLLEHALTGARSLDAETECVQLYDMSFQGCRSCFSCKARGSRSYGRCAVVDDATPILRRFSEIDGVILGSPIYFGSTTGEMRSFIERLLFPFMTYTDPPMSLAPRPLRVALVYTMNVDQQQAAEFAYPQHLQRIQDTVLKVFKNAEVLCCYDTLQSPDYSKYVADKFAPERKAARRATAFPADCRKAYELGKWLAGAELSRVRELRPALRVGA
jgi:multimeric flavodoxin WrbA